MDIDAQATLLAWHAALSTRPRELARVAHRLAARSGGGFAAFDTAAQLSACLAEHASKIGLKPRWNAAENAIAWSQADPQHHIVTLADPRFPRLLREIANPPTVLFIDGQLDQLWAPQLAIVGSRKATPAACEIASTIATELVAIGVTVTSGLARGVDRAAHQAAVQAGGASLAVFGCGIDRIYPANHRLLASSLTPRGALISEFPFGFPPRPHHFPQRNRIIAGLSLGTLVVEAAARSGSISTAMHALEQGRDVFAVPGSVLNPLSRGCHNLLKQGARLTETIDDIVDELPQLVAGAERIESPQKLPEGAEIGADQDLALVLRACGWEPFTVDDLASGSGLTVPEVCSMLLSLELAGRVKPLHDGTYMRVR